VPIIEDIHAFSDDMTSWRRSLHAYPEIAFEEHRTSAFVAEMLVGFGFDVHRGLAGTGVVGTLTTGDGPAIGLRADMDALPIDEVADVADVPHRSQRAGHMHACGHDGHTAMLLGAARYLAASRRFRGTVHVIFQPAEENEGGGRVMVEEGLFDRFPVEAVYGLHNWPGMPAGHFAVGDGPMMASCDSFEIAVSGHGCHGAMPHYGTDVVVAAAAMVGALQTIVTRRRDPVDPAVLSVTQIHAGDTWNVIPATAVLRGTVRCFRAETQDLIESAIRSIAKGTAEAHGCSADVAYRRQYPATVNTPEEARKAALAAVRVVGREKVVLNPPPTMGSEDFSFMLQAVPGCYVWLGAGRGAETPTLHSPRYDFNDSILPVGASYWASLAETILA